MSLKKSSIALPETLFTWVDEEAKAVGMTRNSYITMKLMICKETQHGERLRRLETRVTQLEHKLNSGL